MTSKYVFDRPDPEAPARAQRELAEAAASGWYSADTYRERVRHQRQEHARASEDPERVSRSRRFNQAWRRHASGRCKSASCYWCGTLRPRQQKGRNPEAELRPVLTAIAR